MACNCLCLTGAFRGSCHWTFLHGIWIECREVRQCASSASTSWDSKGAASAAGLLHAIPNHQPYSSYKCCLFEPTFSRNVGLESSPYLCDFFLWGFLHDHLYSNNTSYANTDALKQAIQQYCLQISPQMQINTHGGLEDRLTYCTTAAECGLFE